MNPSQNPSSLRSKKEITDTLLSLMKKYPYQDITVKHILLESHIARKTFYRNFTSKDDILDAYIDNVMQKYEQTILDRKSFNQISIIDVIFEYCIENKEILSILHRNNLMYLLLDKWNAMIPVMHIHVVNAIQPVLEVFTPEQVNFIIRFNIGSIWNMIDLWVEHDMKESPEEIKGALETYLNNHTFFS